MNAAVSTVTTQVQLDQMWADEPDPAPVLRLTPTCHPRAGLEAQYHKATGTLCLFCKRCRGLLEEIKVAPR